MKRDPKTGRYTSEGKLKKLPVWPTLMEWQIDDQDPWELEKDQNKSINSLIDVVEKLQIKINILELDRESTDIALAVHCNDIYKQIEELKTKEKPVEKAERWKPNDDERYWSVTLDDLGFKYSVHTWTDNYYDRCNYVAYNCYRTEAEALSRLEAVKKALRGEA